MTAFVRASRFVPFTRLQGMVPHRDAGGWLTGVVLAHSFVTLPHGRAHAMAAVALSTLSAALIGIVVVAAPLVG